MSDMYVVSYIWKEMVLHLRTNLAASYIPTQILI